MGPPTKASLSVERRNEETTMNKREERFRPLAAEVRNRVSVKLGDIWWAFMLRGAFAGILGICVLIWPTPSFIILTRMIGLYCLGDGLAGLAGALRASDRGAYLLQAVVGLAAGGVMLFWPSTFAHTLLMVFGAWTLFTGASHILRARQANVEEQRGLMTTMGGAVALVGLILLIWPGTGVVTISWIIALAALLFAALFIFLALRLEQLKKRVDQLASLRSN
jgi:uncharacterized membrane protein HdeD (DUF308 family)